MVRTYDFPLTTNDQSYERVLNAGLPVALVFLDAAPSAQLLDAMNRLAKVYSGELLLARLSLAESPVAASKFAAQHGPLVITLRDGQEHSRGMLIRPDDLEAHARYLLGKGPRPADEAPRAASAAFQRPVNVTDSTFAQEVLRSDLPVLVDFWAPWCGPCRSVAPVLDRLSQELAGRMKIAKINVDENPGMMQQYGVQGIPTMLVVKGGKVIDRWVGALPEPAIRGRIARLVG